ncbi:MAG: ABC transporter ATP-binding protein [Clostridia bacterium]|nr:ABC transporter ATP-binding protein [Clostridia bacterium]
MNENEIIDSLLKDQDTNTEPEQETKTIPDYEEMFSSGNRKKTPFDILKIIASRNKAEILISSVLFTIKSCAVWIIPIITANVINIATTGGEDAMHKMLINIALLMVVIFQNIPSHVIYARFTDKMLRTTGAGLRNTVIKKLQHLSISFHKEIESGRLQSKFMRDIEAVEFFNNHFMKSVIPCIIGIIISIGISAFKSGIVTLFFLVVIPLNVIMVTAFQKTMKRNNRHFREENENISAKVSSMIDMIPVTKAHGLENEEIHKLEENIRKLREEGLILDKTNAYFGSISWVLSTALSGLCLLFTGILALKGKIQVGDIVLYQTYFNSITGNVQSLVNIYPELSKGLESIRSISEIINSDETEDNKGKISLKYVHGSVDFRDVCFRYPHASEYSIKNFNLRVSAGECIALVGASGSGKSTVMNLVIGFFKATSGEIAIDGKNINLIDLTSYRHFISVVPQNCILFTGTIRDNITYGLSHVDEARLQEVIHLANIDEFTNELPDGINTFIGENGGKLSGGQKQRISIARALIRDPKILILDEATSALDNISEYHVQQAMNELIKGRTTFIVAHRLSTIRDADRIVVMDKGEIVECGDYDSLMAKKGYFYELKNLNG